MVLCSFLATTLIDTLLSIYLQHLCLTDINYILKLETLATPVINSFTSNKVTLLFKSVREQIKRTLQLLNERMQTLLVKWV